MAYRIFSFKMNLGQIERYYGVHTDCNCNQYVHLCGPLASESTKTPCSPRLMIAIFTKSNFIHYLYHAKKSKPSMSLQYPRLDHKKPRAKLTKIQVMSNTAYGFLWGHCFWNSKKSQRIKFSVWNCILGCSAVSKVIMEFRVFIKTENTVWKTRNSQNTLAQLEPIFLKCSNALILAWNRQ